MDKLLSEFEGQASSADDGRKALNAYLRACDTLGINKSGRVIRKVWHWTQRISAVLLIPLLGGLAYLSFFRPDAPQPTWTEVVVPTSLTQDILLSDGSKLTLSPGSRLTYPDIFCTDTREVFLDGEIKAEITKDPEHPFIIHSGNSAVKVYGTKFNFKTYSQSDYVEVLLVEGAISFDVRTGSRTQTVPMKPGEFVQYSRSTEIIEKTSMDEASISLFTSDGTLKFRDVPLKDVVADLSRKFGEEIIICNAELEKKKIFALFSNGENLETILSSITVSLGYTSLTHNGNVWLINSI